MNLTIKDRFLLLSILPHEGDISTIRIVRDLRAALSFSEEEHARLKVETRQSPQGTTFKWDETAPQTAEIEIKPKAFSVIQAALLELGNQKKLTEDFIPLWDAFEPDSK